MADVVIAASDVVLGTDEEFVEVAFLRTSTGTALGVGTAGEAVAAGQVVYKNGSDGDRLYLADNGTEAQAEAAGVAMNSAAVDQVVVYATAGPVYLGPVLQNAEVYALSSTLGAVAQIADVGAGSYLTHLGYGDGVSILYLDIRARGLLMP